MSGKLYQVQNGQKVDVTPTIAALTDVSSKADVTLGNLTAAGNVALAHAAMPSYSYIDLTLPASGTPVAAPADGWFYLDKTSSAANQFVALDVESPTTIASKYGINTFSSATGQNLTVLIPIKKGGYVYPVYSAGGTELVFRFIYANGSAPQP